MVDAGAYCQAARRLVCTLMLFCLAAAVLAQDMNVTYRWIPPDGSPVVRAFLPGEFNGWGPNSNGFIAPGAASQMDYDSTWAQWLYTTTLQAGQTYQYKVHLHFNATGSQNSWISDPLNDRTNPNEYNNSVVTIEDPMVFQMARQQNAAGEIVALSAGVFGSHAITALRFAIDGMEQDGMPHFKDGIFHYALPTPAPCGMHFALTATDSMGTVVQAEVGRMVPTIVDAKRPAGLEDGVTYHASDPTQATLSLFAPGKCYVHVIGDFNSWQIDDAYLMQRDAASPDSVHWWIELENLSVGAEIAYQYVVDGTLRIADLFAEKILHPSDDRHILRRTYPNLKPYPDGLTDGVVSVMETARTPYAWTTPAFEPPKQSELVIYELLVRDFLAAHDYATLTDTLNYLQRLGINAIELMPVAEFGGNVNWGYQPNFYFAPDKYYGPANDLKRFVDAAHERGIAVILDVVYNHVDQPSPLVLLYGASDSNRWLNIPPRHAYNVFYDLNHEDSYTQYWLDRANAYWTTEFKIDGFRFDLSKGMTQRNTGSDFGAWASYDASRIRLLSRMAERLWAINPHAYVILEHFAVSSEEQALARYGTERGLPGMMLWNKVSYAYGEAVMGYHDDGGSDFARTYFGEGGGGWAWPHTITYMESHDEQWMMYKMRRYGACEESPTGGAACNPNLPGSALKYNVRRLPVALDRLKMAGAFFFLVPGPRMMWQFGELGYGFGERGEECLRGDDCPTFAPARTAPKPIRWDYYDDVLRAKLYGAWSALINLRQRHEVFRSPETEVTLDVAHAVKRIHLSHPTMEVEITGNFGVRPAPNASRISTPPRFWYDFFTGDSLDVTGNRSAVLQPGEFHIYSSVRLETPPQDLVTVDAETSESAPEHLILEAIYPNPFAGHAMIAYTLPRAAHVRLEVFDILGRRVALITDGYRRMGRHIAQFDAAQLPSGLYICRLLTDGETHTQSMLHTR